MLSTVCSLLLYPPLRRVSNTMRGAESAAYPWTRGGVSTGDQDVFVETLQPDVSPPPCVCGPELSLLSPTYPSCYDGSREYLQGFSKPFPLLPMFCFLRFLLTADILAVCPHAHPCCCCVSSRYTSLFHSYDMWSQHCNCCDSVRDSVPLELRRLVPIAASAGPRFGSVACTCARLAHKSCSNRAP